MSTTVRKLFSYDREEDADIHEFLNQLPKRQHSKYIRIALRILKAQLETGEVAQSSRTVLLDTTSKTINKQTDSKHDEDDDFEDLSDDILNMGK